MSHLNFKFVQSANLFNLQPISGRRIWCFAPKFSCINYIMYNSDRAYFFHTDKSLGHVLFHRTGKYDNIRKFDCVIKKEGGSESS